MLMMIWFSCALFSFAHSTSEVLRPISVPRLKPGRPLMEVFNFRSVGITSRLQSNRPEGSTPTMGLSYSRA
jgi:hypothetical protein